jgi:hypothetical protein
MPSTQKRYTVAELTGFDGLKLETDAAVPHVGENDVLVKCKLSMAPFIRRSPANNH